MYVSCQISLINIFHSTQIITHFRIHYILSNVFTHISLVIIYNTIYIIEILTLNPLIIEGNYASVDSTLPKNNNSLVGL